MTSKTVDDIIREIKKNKQDQSRINIIVPKNLHDRIKLVAKERAMSMNAFLVELLDKIIPNINNNNQN